MIFVTERDYENWKKLDMLVVLPLLVHTNNKTDAVKIIIRECNLLTSVIQFHQVDYHHLQWGT